MDGRRWNLAAVHRPQLGLRAERCNGGTACGVLVFVYARPGAELRKAFAELTPEQAAELETGLRAVWDDPLHADMFPGGYDAKLSAD